MIAQHYLDDVLVQFRKLKTMADKAVAQVNDEQLFRLMIANVRDYAIFMLTPSGHIATWNLGGEVELA